MLIAAWFEIAKKMKVKVTQLCLTLCNPMGCSLPGSSVHGTLQARTLDWVVVPFSRGSSQPRGQTQVEPHVIESSLQADSLPSEPPEKQKKKNVGSQIFINTRMDKYT